LLPPNLSNPAPYNRVVAFRNARRLAFWAGLALLLTGCAALPRAAEYRLGTLAEAVGPQQAAALTDGRAGFRSVFCALDRSRSAPQAADPDCERSLWRLADEPPGLVGAPPPSPPARLRFVLVTGAFDDCYGDEGLPFHEAALDLVARGYRLDTARLSGRSSSAANAGALARELQPMLSATEARLVLIGYSKGTVDILEAIASHPELAASVAAVVSVAGPVLGTPLAAEGAPVYDALFRRALASRCSPGDGGVLDSLRPATREAWLAANPLPNGLRTYSLLALPEGRRIARALKPSWRLLARSSRYNDGQVRLQDGLIPGSTLLGFANADHWGIALRIERVLPQLAARTAEEPYPQRTLLEAIILSVGAAPSQGSHP
jgi:hypothetical protein